jgi:hypothetical protein
MRWTSQGFVGFASLGWPVTLVAGLLAAGLFAANLSAATQAPDAPAEAHADGLVTLTRDLTLTVSEDGPNQPWTVTLANGGSEPLGFIADPGLLWFDVTLPGRATQSCRLPEPLRPSSMQRKSVLVLAPGEQYSRRFDPRFFCFAELGQILLVPGAKVTPNFGWPREPAATTKPKSRAGSKRSAPGAASAAPATAGGVNFVAWRLSDAGAHAAESPAAPQSSAAPQSPAASPSPAAPHQDRPRREPQPRDPQHEEREDADSPGNGLGPTWRMPTEGLSSIQGATLQLSEAYASWLGSTRRDAPRDMQLVMLAGSDAEDERNATVTFGVVNALDHAQQIFVRRELLEYDVQGPDGYFECPSSDVGSPDFGSFSTLRPHGAERAVVRLLEICPRRSFARPGLYEVRARFAAKWAGHDLGLDAFVGELETPRPAFVRVRSGDRSSFTRLVVPPPGAPSGRAAPGGAEGQAEAAPDAPPADDTPDNPNDDTPATPEQAPAPEPPPVE